MIQSNELRLGNRFKDIEDRCYMTVDGISEDNIHYAVHNIYPLPITLEAVPVDITPSIWTDISMMNPAVKISADTFTIMFDNEVYKFKKNSYPLLHNVQNLFHGITKRELKITESI